MFTVFRDGQQIKVLHALCRILHPLPQHSLLQQSGNLVAPEDKTPKVLLRPLIGRAIYKPVSGSIPVQYATCVLYTVRTTLGRRFTLSGMLDSKSKPRN